MKILKYILIIISVLIITVGAGLYYSYSTLNTKIPVKEEIIIIVPQNASIDQIVRILNANKIFEPSWFFEIAMKVYAQYGGGTYYAGSYKFTPLNTNKHVIESIFSGKNLHILRVTYPEGITIKRFATISNNKIGVDAKEFLRLVNMDSFLSKYDIPVKSAEGYLMPDTYEFFYGVSTEELVNKLMSHHKEIWDINFAERANELGLSKHEVLTMASIIESETQIPEERPIVSGVYHNRLKKGWLLEADPTVQYALGEKKRLLYRDLEIDHPYNTYRKPGLPPGPINNPGKASIEAALYPAIHNFMFFVALGDGSGKHNFAETYSEHLNYVRIFRRNVRANK
jgi:UPF0755 protein